jgi:hypothetical protein
MWYSICIIYNSSDSVINITINDFLLVHMPDQKYLENKPINLSNQLLLGGKGCTNGYGSFRGHLTDLNAWDRPLSPDELTEYNTGCNEDFISNSNPKAIVWSQLNFTYLGKNTIEEIVSRAEICPLLDSTEKTNIKILGYKLPFQEAFDLCSNLGGEMPSSTKQNFNDLLNINLTLFTECKKRYFWVPIKKSQTNSSVYVEANNEDNTVDFMPWGYGQSNGK